MKLLILVGSGAVGKMTVGQSIMRKTALRLFHNHMMIEPVIEIFGEYNHSVVAKLRRTIFEEFLKTEREGLIFTYMWAFDCPEDGDLHSLRCGAFSLTRRRNLLCRACCASIRQA